MPMPKKPRRNCLNCGKECKRACDFFCDNKCQGQYYRHERIAKGIAGWACLKSYLKETRPHECSICHIKEWMSKPAPLIVDHIDGNSDNNKLDNLRFVCGNCDMQLPTYKSKNKGNGRAYRRQRYAEGKSY